MVDLGGEILYISMGPVAQLIHLKVGVRRGLEFRPFETGDHLKAYQGDHTNPGGEPRLEGRQKEGEETLGEARDRFETDETDARRLESWIRLISPTS